VPRRYSYRFLFAPGTIGAITWLALNEQQVSRIQHGLVVACAGDRGRPTYKRSRRGNADIDRAVAHVFRHAHAAAEIESFSPYGYDERQFCSPGFNLPVGVFSRTPHGRFPEYHTSADNLDFVDPDALVDSLATLLEVIGVLEGNELLLNVNPKCEPRLGHRGLYASMGGHSEDRRTREEALLWVLNLSDGTHGLLEIAERSGMAFPSIRQAATSLVDCGLLTELPPD
jgi:aminopeptidase-like protein